MSRDSSPVVVDSRRQIAQTGIPSPHPPRGFFFVCGRPGAGEVVLARTSWGRVVQARHHQRAYLQTEHLVRDVAWLAPYYGACAVQSRVAAAKGGQERMANLSPIAPETAVGSFAVAG